MNRGTIKSEDVSALISDLKNSLQEVKKEKERKSFLQSISNAKALEEENQQLHQQIETLVI